MKGPNRIFLVGFMGCGKSTVAGLLARSLGAPLVDLDERISEALGASVAEIFARHGERVFRREETRQLRLACTLPRVVVATGGGTFVSRENRAMIRAAEGWAVFLDVAWPAILARLPGKNRDRPLFDDPAAARELLEHRRPAYLLADLHLELDGTEPPEEVARRILRSMPEVG